MKVGCSWCIMLACFHVMLLYTIGLVEDRLQLMHNASWLPRVKPRAIISIRHGIRTLQFPLNISTDVWVYTSLLYSGHKHTAEPRHTHTVSVGTAEGKRERGVQEWPVRGYWGLSSLSSLNTHELEKDLSLHTEVFLARPWIHYRLSLSYWHFPANVTIPPPFHYMWKALPVVKPTLLFPPNDLVV